MIWKRIGFSMQRGISDKLISVILPFRNGDPVFLRRAVDSVLRQKEADFEVLLADDGSEAEFGEIADKLAQEEERIRVIHMEPTGVSAARNRAMQEAEGDVITFLDSDDAVAPYCFAEALQVLTEHPELDGIWGGTCFLNPDDMEKLLQDFNGILKRDISELILLDPERLHQTRAECIGEPYRFQGGYINRGIAARFLRKKALLENNLLFPEEFRMYEDTIWNLEMMERLALGYVPKVWYYYLDNVKSVSNTFHRDGLERIEQPLVHIQNMLDLTDPVEYEAYTRFLMDSLRYVYRSLYGHPEWRPDPGEKQKLKRHLYTEAPWNEIGSRRFRARAAGRDRRKAMLYSMHLLLACWGAGRQPVKERGSL